MSDEKPDLDWVEETTWFEEMKNPVKERTDTERIDWLARNATSLDQNTTNTWQVWHVAHGNYPAESTIRLAIDAAMDLQESDDAD